MLSGFRGAFLQVRQSGAGTYNGIGFLSPTREAAS